MTFVQITVDMVDAFQDEWDRWTVRKNKKHSGIEYEIIRTGGPDEPVSEDTIKVVDAYRHKGNSEDEMNRLRVQNSIKAALAVGGIDAVVRPDPY